VVSEEKIFNVFYVDIRETDPAPFTSMFFKMASCILEISKRVIYRLFMLNIIQIWPVVSEEKIFLSFLHRCIRETGPPPGDHVFLDIIMNFRNPTDYLC